MKFWACVNNKEWFPFLSARGLYQVNFWRLVGSDHPQVSALQ